MGGVSSVVEWCLSNRHRVVAVGTAEQELVDALRAAGLEVVDPDSPVPGPGADAAVWVNDAVSCLPRPTLGIAVRPGGDVLVEASLGFEGTLPVVVEADRVALVTGDGANSRRVDIVGSVVAVRPVDPWPLPELDRVLADDGFELVRRWVGWSGEPVRDDSPCHLSWFRNVEGEPG
jgi:hypothetical protein